MVIMDYSHKILTSWLLIIFMAIGMTITPIRGIKVSAEDIEWQINEGQVYEWTVTENNGSNKYLPENSEFQMTIDSITSSGLDTAQINVTLTAYNSSSQIEDIVMENAQYVFFNSSSETLNFTRGWDTDTGVLIPSNHVEAYADALNETYETKNRFNDSYYTISDGILTEFHSYESNKEYNLSWYYTDKGLSNRFTIEHNGTVIYQVELSTSSYTSNNNNTDDSENGDPFLWIIPLLVISGVSLTIGIFYIMKRKGKI
ncbi:MAG: hypothetical protein R6U96_03510 [Promethearchaeia archaeon]